jgi:hypothetical protein
MSQGRASRRTGALILGPCLCLVVLLGACSSSKAAGGNGDKQTTTTSVTATTVAPSSTTSTSYPVTGPSVETLAVSKTVTVGGKTVKVPTDSGRYIPPTVADGQDIIISVGGFLPTRLYSNPSEKIVWTNLTEQPEQVIFDYFPVKSPVIPPGGSWSWETGASESIAYHSTSGMHAVVVINPPGL